MIRRRTVLRIWGIVVAVLLMAATYQGTITAFERRRFPPPGRYVDVGDHQLHIHCVGEGSPVVILEAPAAGVSVGWSRVQSAVSRRTRVCSYDRAGLGWSWRSEGYDFQNSAEELRTALVGENGPFVLVGHGFGATLVRLFASRFAEQAAALVLIDDPVDTRRPEDEGVIARYPEAWPWLARFGLLRANHVLSKHAEGLPPADAGAVVAFLNRPDHLMQAARELSQEREAIDGAASVRLPAVPVSRIDVHPGRRVAFVAEPEDASRVTAAVVDVVEQLR